jgi:hypothetical protein
VRYSLSGVVVTDSVLFARTGDIGRWAHRVETSFTAHAIKEAPSGADTGRINKTDPAYPVGSLRRNTSGSVSRVGPRQYQTDVTVDVPYALAVLRGSRTIYARGAGGRFANAEEGMYIPGNPGWGSSRWAQKRAGQKANNFLERAFTATARSHSSLRGFTMVGGI